MNREEPSSSDLDAFLALPPSGQFSSLCADICEQVVLFVGVGSKGGDWSSLTLLNKNWYDYVAQCPEWKTALQRRFPFTYQQLQSQASTSTTGTCWRILFLQRVDQHDRSEHDVVFGKTDKQKTVEAVVGMGQRIKASLSVASHWAVSFVKRPKPKRVLLLGLDAAGKTTMVYKIRMGDLPNVVGMPVIGWNPETFTYKGCDVTSWDIGGQEKVRPLWRHYYPGTDGLIFVVDCNDRERLPQIKHEIFRLLSEEKELRGLPLLIFANKQDLPNALTVEETAMELDMGAFNFGEPLEREWSIVGSVFAGKQRCVPGTGLYEGLDWLIGKMK